MAELATDSGKPQRSRKLKLTCTGLRAKDINERVPCPVDASIRVSTTLHTPG